jgi:GH24 family phage-related lysozyme (muramidase)
MAISSPIKIVNVTKGFNSLRAGLGSVKKSAQGIKSILFNRTKVKKQAISGKKVLRNRRRENVLRKEQQDILEASGIKPTIRRTRTAIVDSSKGFLGRILDFVGTLFVGWLLYNLPTLIAMTTDLITRIKTLFGALSGFIGNIFNVFGDIGNILGGVLSNIVRLDFLDSDRKVRSAFDDLNTHFDDMGKQFEDGVKSLTTPLGKGAGEEEIPSTGTVQSGPTAITGSEQEKVEKVLGSYEGSRLKAYKDAKGIWTIGEGNTRINGRAVREGDTITAEQSIQMKRSAIEEHRQRAINQVGLGKWNSLSENARVALTSLVYNYGSIPRSVLPAVRSGDSEKIASAIEGLSGDDGGINAWRRKDEAQIIRTGSSSRVKLPKAKFGSPQYSTTGAPISGKGGKVVEYLTGDRTSPKYRADHGGGNYHDHIAFDSREARDAAMGFLRGKGWTIGSINTGKHASGSYHYSNRAFDIPFYPNQSRKGVPDNAKGETALSSRLRADLIAGGFGGSQLGGSSGLSQSQVSAPPSAPPSGITPERRGSTVAVMDNRQPQQPTPSGGGGGGGSAPTLIPSSDGLNSFIKQNLLLDLAYT